MIGERIRDKVAASKARGMWMGGKVPLGYDVIARKLIVSEDEAPRVRRVFELFIETGSGTETAWRLQAEEFAMSVNTLLNFWLKINKPPVLERELTGTSIIDR